MMLPETIEMKLGCNRKTVEVYVCSVSDNCAVNMILCVLQCNWDPFCPWSLKKLDHRTLTTLKCWHRIFQPQQQLPISHTTNYAMKLPDQRSAVALLHSAATQFPRHERAQLVLKGRARKDKRELPTLDAPGNRETNVLPRPESERLHCSALQTLWSKFSSCLSFPTSSVSLLTNQSSIGYAVLLPCCATWSWKLERNVNWRGMVRCVFLILIGLTNGYPQFILARRAGVWDSYK
jgi:hypothetical protein